MQVVQNIGSGGTSPRKESVLVTEPNTFKNANEEPSGFNRLSSWQQHLLLQVFGFAWMGVVMGCLTYIAQPVKPSVEAAKAVPAHTAKPAAIHADSTVPVARPVKLDSQAIVANAVTPM
jgi:hypothetical protein